MLFADQQRRPPQLGAPPPVVGVEADRVVAEAAELAHRDELVEELRRGLRKNSWSEFSASNIDRPLPPSSMADVLCGEITT